MTAYKKMCFNCTFFHTRDIKGRPRKHKNFTPVYFCGSLRKQVKLGGYCCDWGPSKDLKNYLIKNKIKVMR